MQSIAASLFAKDLKNLQHWLKTPLAISPIRLPEEEMRPNELPWITRELLHMVEEFRTLALVDLGPVWRKKLPGIPVTRNEIKGTVGKQIEQDELKVIKLLESIHSESAGIIEQLQLTKEIVIAALSVLREKHEAQINLISILTGTRFKYHFHGVVVPTFGPNRQYGRTYGEEDGFKHMSHCYGLEAQVRQGPEAIDFLAKLARQTVTKEPSRPTPMYITS